MMKIGQLIMNEDGTVDIATTFCHLQEVKRQEGDNLPDKQYWDSMHRLADCILNEMLETAKGRLAEMNADEEYAAYKLGRLFGEEGTWHRWAMQDSLVDLMLTSADLE